ncbi:MAG: biotin/lipoyl-binding protein [Caldilineaceae bacterium]|nr:biotin/lipoyl-binding protein [Caldilineaceae bacterium]
MQKLTVLVDDHEFEVELRAKPGHPDEYEVTVNGAALNVYLPEMGDPAALEWLVIDGKPYELTFERDLHWVQSYRGRHLLAVHDRRASVARPVSGDGRVKAPIPGLIAQVLVTPGQVVEAGQTLLVLEAMKMENEIRSPRTGTVRQIKIQPGQTVTLAELLIEIE